MKRNILTIFLASPGDLEQERKAIRSIADRINKTLGRRIGWQVELLGWEDTLPSYNRPQALINKDVDSCDLFIGMLWKRWGQPTGIYSSGFEEEFERVKTRRTEDNEPEIWLLFKAIDEEAVKDPGEQLKRVLTFREDQIQKKELYFKEFNEENYKDIIYDDLLSYIIELNNRESEKEHHVKEEDESSKSIIKKGDSDSDEEQKATTKDVVELFGRLSQSISSSEIEHIDFWDKARLFLTAFSWYSKAQSNETLENHEINLIFFKRYEWDLSQDEKWLIFRSIIADVYNLRPGWCWLTEYDEDKVAALLSWFSINDSNKKIRKNSISSLALIKRPPSEEVIESCLQDEEEVVLETLNLLKVFGEEQHIQLIT